MIYSPNFYRSWCNMFCRFLGLILLKWNLILFLGCDGGKTLRNTQNITPPGSDRIPIVEENEPQTRIPTGITSLAKVVYVKVSNNAPVPEDGLAWASAYHTIEDAFNAHKTDAELILAVAADQEIITSPKPGSPGWLVLTSFSGSEFSIYGGFKGDETDLSHVEGKGTFLARPVIMNGDGRHLIFYANFNLMGRQPLIKFFGIVMKKGSVGSGTVGGALSIRNARLELGCTKWIANHADGGGAIFAEKSPITFTGPVWFIENHSDASGGAITAINSPITCNAPVRFLNNDAGNGNGGALRLFNSLLTINDVVTFTGNKALTGGTAFSSNSPVVGDVSKIKGAKKASGSNDWEQD
jgi:hypothetical protein